ncbi:MAG: discoidin domain-containing protein [Verrucomicrobia bacterium]|nr:discoidin domain-containing protein [Verrucomicrobiota bacterium]
MNPHRFGRGKMLPAAAAAGLLIFALTSSAASNKSEWVYPGPDRKLVYKTTPTGDHIMDFSTAGYMGGGVAIPAVPVAKTVKPSGAADETAAIQAAIDEVAALPLQNGFRGAVLLAPGTFICSNTIVIPASGIVLRGSGSGAGGSIIQMIGGRHVAIATRGGAGGGRGRRADETSPDTNSVRTLIMDSYVPSGTISFTVTAAKGFAVGDVIEIRRPVTEAWVRFMGMDNLTRNGKPQTWIRAGGAIPIERRIAAISGNKITLDVPLSDSFDSEYLNPPGTAVVKINPPARLTQVAVENLHIVSPPQAVNHTQELYTAMRLNGEDCWVRDVVIDETMNSVSLGGRRITLRNVTVNRVALHQGASKPAEFAPNGDQILLDRCAVNADNVWFAATGNGHSGPIVFLNCHFTGNGHIEGHMRWTTGMLLDNCALPGGGIDFKNRGAMGSGHGWGMGWAVAWNCVAKSYVVQQPPGAMNWAIGCIGQSVLMSRPFDSSPLLPVGTFDSPGKSVTPQSLYLTQLNERLGPSALKNIGYASPEIPPATKSVALPHAAQTHVDKVLGWDFAFDQPVNASNVRGGQREFAGGMAVDGDDNTCWATDDGAPATLELDMDGPTEINALALAEATGLTGRVQEYKVEAQVDSDWKLLAQGTSIGARKVDHFPKATVWKVRLTISKAQPYPAISQFGLYLDKSAPPAK